MGIRNFIKNTAKNNLNVKGWSSWNAIREHGQTVLGLAKEMSPVRQTSEQRPKTFDEAMKQYGLTEKDLPLLMRRNLLLAIFCALLGLVALVWALYLFAFRGFFLSGLVGVALSALMLSYAFREHFNYYQIKHRKLNCTVKEWLSSFGVTRQK